MTTPSQVNVVYGLEVEKATHYGQIDAVLIIHGMVGSYEV
jgi:stalled ribosome rescue protein Dom34